MSHYSQIAKGIEYLKRHSREKVKLQDVSSNSGLSPFYFQRLFTRYVGVSPTDFSRYLTAQEAKLWLSQSRNTLDTSLGVGLSGSGRLHDLLIQFEGMTPGEFKKRGRGLEIEFGFHETPLGLGLIAVNRGRICGFDFVTDSKSSALECLRKRWPDASLKQNQESTLETATAERLHAWAIGSPFQIKVWEAILNIPQGFVLSYEDLAKRVGSPSAARAVGSALGKNPIAYLIPCHRVIQATGALGGYRWGLERKQCLLGAERF